MKHKDIVEVGDFVKYKEHLMAVVAIEGDKIYALCHENNKIVRLGTDTEVKIAKKAGCKSIVRAIYSDMEYYSRMNK